MSRRKPSGPAVDDVLAWVVACNINQRDRDGLNILLGRVPLERVSVGAIRDAVAVLLRDLGPDDLAGVHAWALDELANIARAAAEQAEAAN